MRAEFTTADFGDEAASVAAAEAARPLGEEYHLFGTVVLEHPGQPRLAIYDDLPFLVPDLCAEAPSALERTGEAEVSLIDWPNTFRLQAVGKEVHLTGERGEDARYPRAELIAALRGCATRFADFLEVVAAFHPQFATKARELRAALGG